MAVYLGDRLAGFNNIINQSNITIVPLSVTSIGTYTAPTGTAYSPINVSIGDNLLPSIIRPDAEKIKSYSADYLAVTDYGATITQPYDTTSRTILAAGAVLTTTTADSEPADLLNYDYQIQARLLTIPIYSIDTVGKGRQEYLILTAIYNFFNIPTDLMKPIVQSNVTYNAKSLTIPSSTISRALIWSSGTALALNTGTSYGVLQLMATAPTITSNKFIIKSPSVFIRGNTTNLTSTYYNALTDVRALYVIDIYRAPKRNLSFDGWGQLDEITKIINCVNNNNKVLI